MKGRYSGGGHGDILGQMPGYEMTPNKDPHGAGDNIVNSDKNADMGFQGTLATGKLLPPAVPRGDDVRSFHSGMSVLGD